MKKQPQVRGNSDKVVKLGIDPQPQTDVLKRAVRTSSVGRRYYIFTFLTMQFKIFIFIDNLHLPTTKRLHLAPKKYV